MPYSGCYLIQPEELSTGHQSPSRWSECAELRGAGRHLFFLFCVDSDYLTVAVCAITIVVLCRIVRDSP